MRIRLRAVVTLAVGMSAAAALPAASQAPSPTEGFRPRIVRQGTISLGFQGEYGTLVGGDLDADFDGGLGLGVRVRFRTGRESALGISFEAHHYDATVSPLTPDDVERQQIITTMAEYYHFFRVRARSPRYVVLGAGLAQTTQVLESGGTAESNDGGVFSAGVGSEIWARRMMTVDLSVRYYGYLKETKGENGLSHAVQAALGLHFYTSR